MTPLFLMNLLNIHATGQGCGPESVMKAKAIDEMMAIDLITTGLVPPGSPPYSTAYKLTEKGEVFVKHVLDTPYPVHHWVVPAHGGGFNESR